jgi:hypothetical protein
MQEIYDHLKSECSLPIDQLMRGILMVQSSAETPVNCNQSSNLSPIQQSGDISTHKLGVVEVINIRASEIKSMRSLFGIVLYRISMELRLRIAFLQGSG